jgi:hypothetical protein
LTVALPHPSYLAKGPQWTNPSRPKKTVLHEQAFNSEKNTCQHEEAQDGKEF